MSNAICINFMIIIQLADSYRVQLVECVANDRPILILFKKGEHYDAIAFKPTVNLRESNMTLPCRPTVVHSAPDCGDKQFFDNDRNDRNYCRHSTFRVAGLNVCGLRSKLNYGIINKFIITNDIMTLTEVKCNASQIMQIEGFDTIFMPAKQRGMYRIIMCIYKAKIY